MTTIEKDRIPRLRGKDLCDRDGGKIGSVEKICLDSAIASRLPAQFCQPVAHAAGGRGPGEAR